MNDAICKGVNLKRISLTPHLHECFRNPDQVRNDGRRLAGQDFELQLANDAMHEIEEDVNPEGLKAVDTTDSTFAGQTYTTAIDCRPTFSCWRRTSTWAPNATSRCLLNVLSNTGIPGNMAPRPSGHQLPNPDMTVLPLPAGKVVFNDDGTESIVAKGER